MHYVIWLKGFEEPIVIELAPPAGNTSAVGAYVKRLSAGITGD